MATTTAPVSDFFAIRENYKLAMAKFNNAERELFTLFGVSNSADLEDAILLARSQGLRHSEALAKFGHLGHALDKASDLYDKACAIQRKKIAEQQRQFNNDVRSLEC